jgi:hypothetical protein
MLQDYRERERLAREAVRKMNNVEWLFTKEGSQFFYGMHMELASIEVLVMLARAGVKNARAILQDRGRDAACSGVNVPRCFHEFVWECFIDGPPKAKSGPGPMDIGLKHLTIALCVKIVSQDYGLPEYCNSDYRDNPDAPLTACRLVAEECGLDERTVEEIWGEYKAMVTGRPG